MMQQGSCLKSKFKPQTPNPTIVISSVAGVEWWAEITALCGSVGGGCHVASWQWDKSSVSAPVADCKWLDLTETRVTAWERTRIGEGAKRWASEEYGVEIALGRRISKGTHLSWLSQLTKTWLRDSGAMSGGTHDVRVFGFKRQHNVVIPFFLFTFPT